jgi:peroxiredoxin
MDVMQAAQPATRRDVRVNDPAPDFTLPMRPAGTFDLGKAWKEHSVVLLFVGSGSPGPELDDMQRLKLAKYGAKLFVASSEPLRSHESDDYVGYLVDEGGRMRQLFGMPGREPEAALPATYVIDPNGIVRHVLVGTDDLEQHVAEALAALKPISQEQPAGIMANGEGRLVD